MSPLLMAAVGYFGAASVFLLVQAPQGVRLAMLVQRVFYLSGLLLLHRWLVKGYVGADKAYALLAAVTLTCLSSLTITSALSGENIAQRIALLLVAVGMMSLDLTSSLVVWVVCWLAWLGTSGAFHGQTLVASDLLLLCGFQMFALATLHLRRRNALRHYGLLQTVVEQRVSLEKVLQEAEVTRNRLDQLVDERTAQLRLAYEELRLSGQQRDEIQRTSEQLQEQLKQAQKMESLGRLAGGVAHDFNNLLTVIMGNLELAQGLSDQEGRECLEQASQAASRAAEVTAQLLAFSRKQVLKVSQINLVSTVRRSVSFLRRVLGEDVELSVDCSLEELLVRGDEGQLQQVIMNLGVNARDAMPRGGVLTLRLQIEKRLGLEWALLSVSDTGHGIGPDTLPHIFEPFFTSKPFGQGTGLGLSTVDGIISQHGGQIEVDSEPGKGTTFKIHLPLAGQSMDANASGSIKIRRVSQGSARLLLVEDDAQVRGLALRILKMTGYHVLCAENAENALALAQQGQAIDMLVTDVVMPGMDGVSLARKISDLQPDSKVLFVSGYTDDRLARFGVDLGDGNFLAKPYTPVALCEKVESLLKA
ncbi:response regulator [bacterium]|nr:response regulator [bacterium]